MLFCCFRVSAVCCLVIVLIVLYIGTSFCCLFFLFICSGCYFGVVALFDCCWYHWV